MATYNRSEYETYQITKLYANITSTDSPRCDDHISEKLPKRYAKDICNLYQQYELLLEINVRACGLCTLRILRDRFLKRIVDKLKVMDLIKQYDPKGQNNHIEPPVEEQENNLQFFPIPECDYDPDDDWTSF